MKRILIMLGLLVATVASAQQATDGSDLGATRNLGFTKVGGVDPSDSTAKILRTDANRNLSVTDAARDRDQVFRHNAIIDRGTTPLRQQLQGQRDSSSSLATLGWNRMALALHWTPDDSTWLALVAVEVRGAYVQASDTLSLYRWLRWQYVDPSDALAGATADTMGYHGSGATPGAIVDSLANGNEFLVKLYASETIGGGSRAKYVPLMDRNGNWFSAPFSNIRVRYIQCYNASGVAFGQSGTVDPPLSVRVDLLGWR